MRSAPLLGVRTACIGRDKLAVMASNASVAITVDSDSEDDSSYYDILLVGKTGTGKSTTGNKLLGVDPATNSLIGRVENIHDAIKQWGAVDEGLSYFKTGEGVDSVTKDCRVLSNELTKDRVLDTRGFADSKETKKRGVLKSNLRVFREILRAQRAHKLRFSRVLYFLPKKGPLERADGDFQEEIKVMHDYFGQKIFDIMVVIATNNKRKKYQVGFDEEDFAQTREAFMKAFEEVTHQKLPACPPVVYLAFNEQNIQELIVGAKVIEDVELDFSPEYPKARTHGKDGTDPPIELGSNLTKENIKMIHRRNHGKMIHFQDRCTRCAVKIVQELQPSGEEIPIQVIFENGDVEEYDNSYCHPLFIPKHSQLVRFAGGIAHIITMGIPLAVGKAIGKKTWPGFTNSDEICPAADCRKSPGSDGCSPVGQLVDINGVQVETNHSKTLDRIITEGN